jgi:hypothetical protein
MAASDLSAAEAQRTICVKDERKRVIPQMHLWKRATNIWIDNTGNINEYQATMRQVIQLMRNEAGEKRGSP